MATGFDDVQHGLPVSMGNVNQHAELVHLLDDGNAEGGEALAVGSPGGKRSDVPLPRKGGRADGVVAQMHRNDGSHAVVVQLLQPSKVVSDDVGAFQAEDQTRPAAPLADPIDNDLSAGGADLGLQPMDLG